ncbi:HNH endonuclease family protein [Thermomonospora catenispora]|uniref:HNH endonuclease family protein n=1 Tax=Thermomonospora catenispora TaxID=2493090 RepID=UPI0011204A27|nr:HNH endonuclease family protein [Thermomonospora catenispora]TNY38776.1 HNH endonuclease [Thermomonospora catenispora]
MRHARRPGLVAITAALTAVACTAEVGGNGSTPAPGDAAQSRRHLAALPIAAEGDGAGYDREDFGVRWRDIDRNGCDQRNDVLARDLTDVVRRGRCVVVSGTLHDPYTGRRISFRKSDADEVQIDHVYPLALAWRMGASRWPKSRREQFANDPDNLLAVWGVPNRQKSDSGPGEWRPRKEYQCTYAIKYIAVATKYRLPVTRADHNALQTFLGRC